MHCTCCAQALQPLAAVLPVHYVTTFKWVMFEGYAYPTANRCIQVKQHVCTAQLLSILAQVPIAPVSAELAA